MRSRENTVIDPTPADTGGQHQNPQVIGVGGQAEGGGGTSIPAVLPILAIRGVVVFPGTVVPLTVRRLASLKLLDDSLPASKIIGLIAQKNETDRPGPDDLYEVGVAANVLKLLRQPDGSAMIAVQALRRIAARNYASTEPYLRAEVESLNSTEPAQDREWEASVRNLREAALEWMGFSSEVPEQARGIISGMKDPGQLSDFLASNLTLDVGQKQYLLEELDIRRRVHTVQLRVSNQIEITRIQQKLQEDVAAQFTDAQRRAYLREQIKAIQRELGEEMEGVDEQVEQLRRRLEDSHAPKEVMDLAAKELRRLRTLPSASPELSVIVSHLEALGDLPWTKLSEEHIDLEEARKILDRDHFDLDKVKRRLIEYLAVRKLNPQGRGPILCFLGPPGVGKTSLGQSIADALGRKFSRMSLGGIRDEAEIRGHRRTYIGSMPGRLMQELRRVGTRNPVIMLDEVDKIGADFRGDPASALLEVLDPRQNHAFVDHYLDVPFDLSQVIFIATANYMEAVPPPLRDRMEVLDIPGYSESDKLQIARQYLVGRQLAENGLKPEQCPWTGDALTTVIGDYTREAGVRELERQIGSVCRGVAARVARGEADRVEVTPELVRELLGPQRYIARLG